MRVALAEDHFLLREGLRRLLETAATDIEVVSADATADGLLRSVRELRPDAVLTDIRMPPHNAIDGIRASHAIRADFPSVGIVLLSQHLDEAYVFEFFKHGTVGLGYLLKDRVGRVDQVVRALRDVIDGRSVIDPEVVEVLVRKRMPGSGPLARLTQREHDVLKLMAQGKTNAGIAKALFVSESAVEKHVSSIFAKLGLLEQRDVYKRVAAVLTFMRAGDQSPGAIGAAGLPRA